MALTVEDGSIVSGANSYISEAEYQSWADARFAADRSTAPANDTEAERLILRAMDYFETLSFIGLKSDENQPLQWPRDFAAIDGYSVESNEIPSEVKNSLYELSYAEEQSEGMSSNIERTTTSESIGPISVSYSSSSSRSVLVQASASLRKILKMGGGLSVRRI